MIKKVGNTIFHVSAGGFVIHRNKILMIKNHYHGGIIPAHGHVEKGESALDAAKREICEETGYCDLYVIRKLGKSKYEYMSGKIKNKKTEYRWLFGLKSETKKRKLDNKESKQLENRWYTVEGALRAASFENAKKDLRIIKEYLKRSRQRKKAVG